MSIFASRLPAIKFLALFAGLNFGLTYASKGFGDSVISIQDYLGMPKIDERTQYTILGVVKPRSIKLAGGLNKRFIITDSINELHCRYEGVTTEQAREGDTTIVTAFCPNVLEKHNIVVKSYVTKHSMEVNEWQKKNNVSSNSYGIEKFK